ncbi:AAA family ATPase [Serinicoccus chungangensis]|uniref:AAA family ATPase n=1 Tax=Serinicoccus chungangensis TaxID=767452 RepID=UPI00111B0F67|nr:AAA family ATPase [Serinicoccus chungangensis]
MSATILVTSSTEAARKVRLAGGDDLTVLQPQQLPATAPQLVAMAPEPDLVSAVLLDVRAGGVAEAQALDVAGRLAAQYPSVSVLLLTDAADRLALPALRGGVRDLVDPDLSMEELRLSLRRAVESATAGTSEPQSFTGRVITVASPKGGVGKTTLATNIAAALAEQAPQGTVLVDLDVQFGDVASALDLQPTYTLGDIVVGPGLSDAMTLKTLLTRHGSGLQVVCGVHSPAEADVVTPAAVDTLLRLLKQEFRFVVLDTAPGLSEQTLAAIDHTTDLVLITSLDVPGVRGLKKELEVLDELELSPSTRHVVVNFADGDAGLTVKDVTAAIGREVDLALPRSPKVPRSTNQGRPMVSAMPKDKLSRAITGFVGRFAHLPSGNRWNGRHRGVVR